MHPDIDSRTTRRRLLWALSLIIGLLLSLRTSELPSEFVRVSPTMSARPVVLMCHIPVPAIAPHIAALSRDIGRRFHLAESAAMSITRAAFTAAQARGIDPTLVLAIAAVESKFKPRAINSATGAKGLMQIMPRWHDKLLDIGGEPSLLLIAPNIDVGAAIIADYLDAEDGDVEDALGHYLGTTGADRYVRRVNIEMAHLTRVLKAT